MIDFLEIKDRLTLLVNGLYYLTTTKIVCFLNVCLDGLYTVHTQYVNINCILYTVHCTEYDYLGCTFICTVRM